MTDREKSRIDELRKLIRIGVAGGLLGLAVGVFVLKTLRKRRL